MEKKSETFPCMHQIKKFLRWQEQDLKLEMNTKKVFPYFAHIKRTFCRWVSEWMSERVSEWREEIQRGYVVDINQCDNFSYYIPLNFNLISRMLCWRVVTC